MGKTLRVHGNMTLDSRDLFTGVIAFVLCTVAILHALRVDDQKACRGASPQFLAGRANLIFLALRELVWVNSAQIKAAGAGT